MSTEERKQVNIRMTASTRAKLDEMAAAEHRSASTMVEVLIEKAWARMKEGRD